MSGDCFVWLRDDDTTTTYDRNYLSILQWEPVWIIKMRVSKFLPSRTPTMAVTSLCTQRQEGYTNHFKCSAEGGGMRSAAVIFFSLIIRLSSSRKTSVYSSSAVGARDRALIRQSGCGIHTPEGSLLRKLSDSADRANARSVGRGIRGRISRNPLSIGLLSSCSILLPLHRLSIRSPVSPASPQQT